MGKTCMLATQFLMGCLLLLCVLTWTGCSRSCSAVRSDPDTLASTDPPLTQGKTAGRETLHAASPAPASASSDLDAAADQIVGDILTLPDLAGEKPAPRILVADSDMESDQAGGREKLAKRLRVELNRVANGRILFVSPSLANIERSRMSKGVDCRLEGCLEAAETTDIGPAAPMNRTLALKLVGETTNRTLWSRQYVVADNPE